MRCPFVIKKCSKCGELLVANTMNFHKKKGGKYGLRAYCKKCQSGCDKNYYEENKEDILARQKEYYEENKEDILARQKEYNQTPQGKLVAKNAQKKFYEENKEEKIAYQKEYNQEHKGEVLARVKKYQQTPKGKLVKQNSNHKRRTQKKTGKGITLEQTQEMLVFFNNCCAYTGKPMKQMSLDHVIPLSKNGEHEVWNIVPMEKDLNSAKSNKDFKKWFKKQPFYSKERLVRILQWIEFAKNKYSTMEDM